MLAIVAQTTKALTLALALTLCLDHTHTLYYYTGRKRKVNAPSEWYQIGIKHFCKIDHEYKLIEWVIKIMDKRGLIGLSASKALIPTPKKLNQKNFYNN